MECFITWQLELENSVFFGRKPIINSLLNKTNEPKKKNEERKLTEQGTKFGSNSTQSPMHRRGSWRLCVLHHEQTTPRHFLIKPRRGHQLGLSTHRRRSPRICVDHHSLSPTASTSTPRRTPGSLGVALNFSTKFRVHV
ncbi:hypothetical protein PIB30_079171 [Stylosanthes scabra]|uniref:Uncharacterized protein n=1 Tax=Stylosanthes scabra TaxID=79078 RepID=A0ABU6VQX3_9FABA|nr:hypothetical protein [Stylosanthes scabra]